MAIKYRAWHKTLEFMLLHDEIAPYEIEQKPTKGDNYKVLDDDDFVIMKATGILDQDENEIFEGDINIEGGVITSEGNKFVIKFEDSDMLSQKLVGGELELIQGNIYETPYKIGIDNQDQDDDYDSDFDDDYDDSGFEDGFDDYDDEDEY